MQVRFAETAERDLIETLAYYQAPSAMGDGFNAVIALAIKHLTEWPYTGHRRRDLTKANVCFWFEDPYLLVFQVSGETLSIVAVLHSSRNVARILRQRLRKSRPTS